MENLNLCWAVYNDADVLVAVFTDESEANEYANDATYRNYVQDGCYYVERLTSALARVS